MPKGLCEPTQAFCHCCGESFLKRAPAARYCSDGCRTTALAKSRQDAERRYTRSEHGKSQRQKKAAVYRAKNADRVSASQATYRVANAERNRLKTMRWRQADPERAKASKRTYYLRNKEKIAAHRRLPGEAAKRSERDRQRKARAPRHRVDDRLSAGIRSALKGRKAGRRWESLVGYRLDDLVTHLERQFSPGMTWLNIGQWHIDHILPKSSFTYSSAGDPEFLACWALTNLRPLWKEANLTKHAKRDLLL